MKNKKYLRQQWIATLFGAVIGAVMGILYGSLIAEYLITIFLSGQALTAGRILKFIILILNMYIAIVLQIIIHEAGHLIFGLASGYTFHSFRIFSFILIRENGKLKLKRLALAGTAGQCLMCSPDMADGKIPVFLYNLGGVIMNIIASALFGLLYLNYSDNLFLSVLFLMYVIAGISSAIQNGVPMRTGMLHNDGYQTISLIKNAAAVRSFWVQLKVSEQIAKGIRLKDMPDEWFAIPSDKEMNNSEIAAVGVLACNRLMDQQKFDEAGCLIKHFLEIDSCIAGLHYNLLVCDSIYCELLNGRGETAAALFTKELKKFMGKMRKFLSVLRTQYVYALLGEKNKPKAESIKIRFEECAKTYPYPGDIQSERELMEIAEKIYS